MADFIENVDNARQILRMIKDKLNWRGEFIDLAEGWSRVQDLLFINCNVTSKLLESVAEYEDILHFLMCYKMVLNNNVEDLLHLATDTFIQRLDNQTEEWTTIKNYAVSTSGSSEVEIQNIYKLKRFEDVRKFNPFRLDNCTLLYHGTPSRNIMSI